MKININQMVKMAVLSAMSIVLMLIIKFPIIPAAPFLEYEPADVPILIGAFMYGPVAGLIITFVVAFIQAVTVSIQSGWIGFMMHVLATGFLVLTAGAIYRKVHSIKGAILGLIAGSLAMTAIMIPANLVFTGLFMKVPMEDVVAMIAPAIIPFNLIKSGINSLLVLVVYKAVSRVFNQIGASPAKQTNS